MRTSGHSGKGVPGLIGEVVERGGAIVHGVCVVLSQTAGKVSFIHSLNTTQKRMHIANATRAAVYTTTLCHRCRWFFLMNKI